MHPPKPRPEPREAQGLPREPEVIRVNPVAYAAFLEALKREQGDQKP